MPRRPALPRRLVTTALWPFGVALTSWHYMWRTTPFHRRERPGSEQHDAPPGLPPGVPQDGIQGAEDGVGPLFHRRYQARIKGARLSAPDLMAKIVADPNQVAPTEFARFLKVKGEPGQMPPGDEYVVRMPGPWNGPVRVVSATPTSFRFVTLAGHLEAGQIEFRVEGDGELTFTIESWARSGDHLSRLLYQTLHMAKEVQLHMWTSFLEEAARLAGGRLVGGIDIDTRRVEAGDHSVPSDDGRRILDQLHEKGLNFEPEQPRDDGWKVDEYRQSLPGERPGPPTPDGPWETARRLLRNYQFADPRMVRAIYHPERPLEERDMLLEARFHGLTFRFGVRVGGVRDETTEVDGRPVRIWGWNYRTLQGHLEMGQMDFQVWKWMDSGDVEFRTCRFSRHASVGNPIVRLGLRLFGRHQQVKFARHACRRMADLTAAALSRGNVAHAADEIRVSPDLIPGR